MIMIMVMPSGMVVTMAMVIVAMLIVGGTWICHCSFHRFRFGRADLI